MTSLNVKGWKKYKLSDIGKTYNGLRGKTKEDFGRGSPFITYKNIFDHWNIDLNDLEYVEVSEDENQNVVERGDVFFTTSSETSEEVGMSSVLLEDPKEDTYLNSFCFGLRFDKNFPLDPLFSKYYFRSELFRKDVIKLAQGSTRFNLSKREFMKLEITLPPYAEQQKIASILSTWDEAIMTYERLKCEVSKQKTALLQKLTNPVYLNESLKVNTCEVGFSEVFERVSIGKNKIKRSEYVSKEDGMIPVVDQGQDYISGYYNEDDKCIYADEESPLIIFGDHTRVFKKITFPFVTGADGTVVLSHNNKVLDSSYAYHLLDALDLPNTGYNRHYKFLLETKFYIPNIKKQKEIGKFLDLYDDYLEQLMNMIIQLQEQKRGLMQLLLTGKVRV